MSQVGLLAGIIYGKDDQILYNLVIIAIYLIIGLLIYASGVTGKWGILPDPSLRFNTYLIFNI